MRSPHEPQSLNAYFYFPRIKQSKEAQPPRRREVGREEFTGHSWPRGENICDFLMDQPGLCLDALPRLACPSVPYRVYLMNCFSAEDTRTETRRGQRKAQSQLGGLEQTVTILSMVLLSFAGPVSLLIQ